MQFVHLPSQGSPREHLAWALDGMAPGGCAAITVRAPVAPLSVFLSAVPRERSFMWHPPTGPAAAGSGAAAEISLSGQERLDTLRRWLHALFAPLVHYRSEDETVVPRAFGGLAFSPGVAREAPWQAFGDGHFVLPRWLYVREGETASLTFATHGRGFLNAVDHDSVVDEFDTIVTALLAAEGQTTRTRLPAYRTIPTECVRQMPPHEWQTLLDQIMGAIRSGKFTKLVAARRCDVALLEPINDIDVVTRLIAEPTCTRFAFRRAGASFLGATPETLFRKRGPSLTTEALAGTIRSLGSEAPVLGAQKAKLLDSDKDALEHEYVVREIDDTLRPLAESVSRPAHAEVRKVRNILHLCTPFSARLKPTTTAFDLLAAMHPTPAVGGLPRAGAAEWIAEHEVHERGWYTGPVGWMDANDDGTFVVAIRSGVITTNMAYVYTGAGVVADSDHDIEYAETELKQLPLLRALGVSAM